MGTRTVLEIQDLKDPEELKKLLGSLSEFGIEHEYDDKKNRIKIKGEIDWCDDEFIGIINNDTELGVTVYKKLTVIVLRRWFGENGMEVKDIRLLFPVKFHYFHKNRELILDLDFRGTHS